MVGGVDWEMGDEGMRGWGCRWGCRCGGERGRKVDTRGLVEGLEGLLIIAGGIFWRCVLS